MAHCILSYIVAWAERRHFRWSCTKRFCFWAWDPSVWSWCSPGGYSNSFAHFALHLHRNLQTIAFFVGEKAVLDEVFAFHFPFTSSFYFLLLISMPNPIWGSSLVEPCIWDSWSREDHLKFSNCTLMERHAHTEGDGLVPSESETRWCCNPSFFGHGQDHQQLKQSKTLFAWRRVSWGKQ